jgi:hypothetical protein
MGEIDGGAAGLVRVAGENESINYTAQSSKTDACPLRVTTPPGANFPRKEVHEAWGRSIAYYRVTQSAVTPCSIKHYAAIDSSIDTEGRLARTGSRPTGI